MRWLIVHPGPNFSVADVYAGWAEALRALGEDVMEYNLDDRLCFFDAALLPAPGTSPDADGRALARKAMTREQATENAADGLAGACYKWWPDVVLCVSAFFIPEFYLQVMRARRHKIVMLFTEAPYQDGEHLVMAQYADVCLVNDPVSIGRYREVCPVAEYAPHSYRPSVHYPAPAAAVQDLDLAFVGTGFPSRIAFFEEMGLDGLDVALGGLWPGLAEDSPLRPHLLPHDDGDGCMANAETAALYRRARAGINFYRREAEPDWDQRAHAIGPREVEMAACGLWFARDPRGESGELFPFLPEFTSPGEASEAIRWALAHDGEREKAAAMAREAIAGRTFGNAAKRLLTLLDK
jgi:spore maturation protein CgeB